MSFWQKTFYTALGAALGVGAVRYLNKNKVNSLFHTMPGGMKDASYEFLKEKIKAAKEQPDKSTEN